MVMSVMVDDQGQVCVAHDLAYDGRPVALSYAVERRSLTLMLDNGRQEEIGSARLPEIERRLHHARHVRLLQLRKPSGAPVEIPLHIQMAG